MRFDIVTIFPDFFVGPFDHGVLSRAIATGIVEVAKHDLRAFTHDRHRTVDDRPFGGGEGMLLKPQPIFDCIESLGVSSSSAVDSSEESREQGSHFVAPIAPKPTRDLTRQSVILLSAQGKPFTQATAHRLAKLNRIVLICGRYEGVDERVNDLVADEELSIGDYVLSGGELAAAVVVDAVVRLIPGVLGHADSNRYESFGAPDVLADDPADGKTSDGVPRSTHGSGGILDYPQYTRPADFRGMPIPDVLANGDHLSIRRWRRKAALAKTLHNRPDLLARALLGDEDREFLASLGYTDEG
jgi:tRNA (guanine37-N1)-methyltransferase